MFFSCLLVFVFGFAASVNMCISLDVVLLFLSVFCRSDNDSQCTRRFGQQVIVTNTKDQVPARRTQSSAREGNEGEAAGSVRERGASHNYCEGHVEQPVTAAPAASRHAPSCGVHCESSASGSRHRSGRYSPRNHGLLC